MLTEAVWSSQRKPSSTCTWPILQAAFIHQAACHKPLWDYFDLRTEGVLVYFFGNMMVRANRASAIKMKESAVHEMMLCKAGLTFLCLLNYRK